MIRPTVISILLVAAFSVILPGCSSCGRGAGDEGPPTDWNRWFPGGDRLPSLAAADTYFPFRLVEPDGLPSPKGIYASGKDAVAFVYDLAPFGRVVVLEAGEPDMAPGLDALKEYQEVAGRSCGRSEAIRIRGGLPALASSSEGWAAIEWVESGRQLSIQMRSGTRDEAIAIANRL